MRFVFGIAAMPNLEELAEKLPKRAFSRLVRPAKYEVKTEPRTRPEKQRVLRMEFSTFLQAFIHVPAQIVGTGRRIV